MSRRTERIAEQLRAEIARILREEVTDPRICGTATNVSPTCCPKSTPESMTSLSMETMLIRVT